MRRKLVGSTCMAAVLSLTAVLGANQATTQTPTQSPVQSGTQGVGAPGTRTQEPATTPSTTTRSAAQANPLTLTGCLSRGANGEFMLMTASAGSSGATAPSGNNSGSVGGSISAGSSTTQPGARATATAAMYRLSGEDFAKLVGKRVEVMGTVQPSTGTASSTASATSSGNSSATGAARSGAEGTVGTTGSASATATMQNLTVTSVKEVTGECR